MDKPPSDSHKLLSIGILSACSIVLYANTLANGFVFDDTRQILNNLWIRDFGHLRDIFTKHVWAFAGRESNYYRPFMHVVYAALYVPFGPAAWVFHLANVLLHCVATLLVYFLAVRILPVTSKAASRLLPTGALASGLIFAAHPIHTETVAWISSLPDLACSVFYVAGLLSFFKALDSDVRPMLFHGLGGICFLSAALFKEPGVTLPVVLLLLDAVVRPQGRSAGFWGTRYGSLCLAGGIYIILRYQALGGFFPADAGASDPTLILGTMGAALWKYFAMLVAPVRLNVFHTLESATGLPPTAALVGFPLFLGVAVWCRTLQWTITGAIFLLPLIPAIYAPALLPGLDNPWAERYVYLSSAGIAIAAGALFDGFVRIRSTNVRIATAVLGAVLIASSIATIQRNKVWKDDLTLWTDAVQKSPNAWAAHSYLGYALFTRGDIDGAIRQYGIAIGMKPGFGDAHHNLGVALATLGDHRSAVKAYIEAIRLGPPNALVHANLSISLSSLGYAGEALSEAEQAVRLDPLGAKGHSALGVALGNAGRIAEALQSFQRAVALDPNDSNSRENMEKAKRLL